MAEVIGTEEGGDDGVEDYGAEGFDAGVWFCDDEVDVARLGGAAPIGAADCDFDGGVFFVDGFL